MDQTRLICEKCGHEFQMGETIYLLHLYIYTKDLCAKCRDAVMEFINETANRPQ